jgi:predicted nucleic acid-binding protein
VPLLLEQAATPRVRDLFEADPEVVAWWGTPVEIVSAAARLRREGMLTVANEDRVLELMRTLQNGWIEVAPSEEVRQQAQRLLRVHPLRAADAFQLAAALVWAGPSSDATLVTFDERLARTARLEAFTIAP